MLKKLFIRFGVYAGCIFIGNLLIAASRGAVRGTSAIVVMLFACVAAEVIVQMLTQNNKNNEKKGE